MEGAVSAEIGCDQSYEPSPLCQDKAAFCFEGRGVCVCVCVCVCVGGGGGGGGGDGQPGTSWSEGPDLH